MKNYRIIIWLVLVFTMAGCSITGRLNRKGYTARMEHSTKQQREYIEERQSEYNRGYIEYTRADSSKVFVIPTTTDDKGEVMMSLEIEQVTVTAPSRSIPERLGKVSLDFVVTLPKELMGNCRGVEVIPVLHKADGDEPLQALTIRGALFDKVQERNYWQFDRYMENHDPAQEAWAYNRFIHYPYPEDVRLDSVVNNKTSISYFYSQGVNTTEAGNRLLISLQGQVQALDRSYHYFALSDTLTFNISSMLSFADTTTRYVTRVVEKYAVVNDRNYLHFPVNRSDIIDTLADNKLQLDRIETLMDEILNQKEFHVDSIILTASASPEGSVRQNENLARDRAGALARHLSGRFPGSRVDSLLTVRWIGEDWTELERLIRGDSTLGNKADILEMIAGNGSRDPDALEREIRSRYSDDYRYMAEHLYPKLRAVSFRYDLRRVGMVKDTIHTTVPDTLYARGVQLMQARKYAQALEFLGGFADRNAAICMLSLGMDERAYSTLKRLSASATNYYLTAIACARTGRDEEALEWFDKACELNEHMKYRGRLDPEIAQLIKQREAGTLDPPVLYDPYRRDEFFD